MGNVVQRDDALYARMKQREIDAYDSMWDPIFVDDAALGLGEQRNKVLEVLKIKTNIVMNLNQLRSEENAVVFLCISLIFFPHRFLGSFDHHSHHCVFPFLGLLFMHFPDKHGSVV